MINQLTEFWDGDVYYHANYDFDIDEGRNGVHSVRESDSECDDEVERKRVHRETTMGTGVSLEFGGSVSTHTIEEVSYDDVQENYVRLSVYLFDRSVLLAMTIEETEALIDALKEQVRYAKRKTALQ